MYPVDVKAFRKMRKYFKGLKSKQIDMEYFVSQMDKAGGYLWGAITTASQVQLDKFNTTCGTAACLAGHAYLALTPKKALRKTYKPTNGENWFSAAKRLLGMENSCDLFQSDCSGWPADIRALYFSGKRGARKRAIIALCDRIIAAKGINW